jgi:hypothetical protein
MRDGKTATPWSPAVWTGGGQRTNTSGYAEIVDGVFGVGVASYPPNSSKSSGKVEGTTVYSRMLKATNNVQGEKVQEMTAFQV